MFSHFTKYTLNMGFEGQFFIQVNAQIFHRFDWRYSSTCHFHTFILTAQEVHKLSLSNMKSQFIFCHPRRYMFSFILKCRRSIFRSNIQLVSPAYKNGTISSQELGKSLTYIRNNSGPIIDPCGTTHSTVRVFEY